MRRSDELAEGWIAGTLSDAEVREFLALLDEEQGALPDMIQEWLADPGFSVWADESREPMLFQKIMEKSRAEKSRQARVAVFSGVWRAAAVIILLAIGSWLIWRWQKNNPSESVAGRFMNDVKPGGNRAILTLSGGATIVLDSAANGALATQGSTKIIKLAGGHLAYQTNGPRFATDLYNTVTTPRGGQYQLTLADGTRVWLDAASSIRFPAEFTGKERRVEITGQAYFEVSKNVAKPFYVSIGNSAGEVEVLGTAFNVNAYSDEPMISATLLQGAVRLHTGKSSSLLKPGQQGQFQFLRDGIELTDNVDMDAVMAWKNGNFQFVQADIHAVMRQINRWYDVDIEYQGEIHAHFGGAISRNVPASKVLKILELTGEVKFSIQGKKIIVMPEK